MLADEFNRTFKYLRLSLGQACNFRCQYCLPNGNTKKSFESELDQNEIINLVKAFKRLGVCKIRLTGGEPTLRTDLLDIVHRLKHELKIDKVVMTTNGYRLNKKVESFKLAGLDGLNISLDTLNNNLFKTITGKDCLDGILEGIEKGLSLNFSTIKINSVLHKSYFENQFREFQNYVRNMPVDVRFIELMLTGDTKEYFQLEHIKANTVQDFLNKNNWKEKIKKQDTDGPARVFYSRQHKGRLGFIDPYSKNFCNNCNRLRVTSTGELRLCLFGDSNYNLRHLLQKESQHEELISKITNLLGLKKEKHYLESGNYGITRNLSQTGG